MGSILPIDKRVRYLEHWKIRDSGFAVAKTQTGNLTWPRERKEGAVPHARTQSTGNMKEQGSAGRARVRESQENEGGAGGLEEWYTPNIR